MPATEPETYLLVDAQNVLRSQWPNIPAGELALLACRWAAQRGLLAVVVFDGDAPAEALCGCAVVGTGGESADDWIIRKARALREGGTPFWLVTSDRALREQAGQGAERTIGGGSFANELRPP